MCLKPNLAGALWVLLMVLAERKYAAIGGRRAHTNKVGKHFFQAKTLVKETDMKEMLARLYNQEFTGSGSPEGKSENGMSVEDVKFVKIIKDGAKMVNKHYQIPL